MAHVTFPKWSGPGTETIAGKVMLPRKRPTVGNEWAGGTADERRIGTEKLKKKFADERTRRDFAIFDRIEALQTKQLKEFIYDWYNRGGLSDTKLKKELRGIETPEGRQKFFGRLNATRDQTHRDPLTGEVAGPATARYPWGKGI